MYKKKKYKVLLNYSKKISWKVKGENREKIL